MRFKDTNPELGLSSRLWRKEPLNDACFREAAEQGFSTLEIFKTKRHFQGTREDILRVRKMAREHGIRVDSLHADLWLLTPVDVETFRTAGDAVLRNLDTLSALEGRILVMHSCVFADPDHLLRDDKGRLHPGLSLFQELIAAKGGALERIREGMARYADAARERGLCIALETDVQCNVMVPDMLAYADPRSSGICFDSGHAHVESDAVKVLQHLGSRVVCTHLHDNDGLHDQHLLPLKGSIDWQGLLGDFMAAAYTGAYTFECGTTMEEVCEAKAALLELRVPDNLPLNDT